MARDPKGFAITFAAPGLQRFQKDLALLEPKLARKALSRAMRDGTKLWLSTARELVPVDTGELRASLKVKAGRRRRGFMAMLVVAGDGWHAGDTFYGAFQEFGWQPARHRSFSFTGKKQSRVDRTRALQRVEGEHYAQHAFEEREAEVMAQLETSLGREIDRHMAGNGWGAGA